MNTKIILSKKARKSYYFIIDKSKFSKIYRFILNSLKNKFELIRNNPQYGNSVNKRLIPYSYKSKFAVNNLFRIELSNFWRMIYFLTKNENNQEIIVYVLDIVDHKSYNKIFNYK